MRVKLQAPQRQQFARGFFFSGGEVMITKAVPARTHTRTFAIGVDYITEHTHQRAVAKVGDSFEGGVAYASAPEKADWVHLRGVMSVETAAIEMEAVAALSKRCRDPVYHLIIAYAKHERPTREQVVSDAERCSRQSAWRRASTCLRRTRTPTTSTPT
jgi:hypothetical protein